MLAVRIVTAFVIGLLDPSWVEVQIEVEIVFDSVETAVDSAVVVAAVSVVAEDVRLRTHYSRVQYIRWIIVEHVLLDFGRPMAVTVAGPVTMVAVAVATQPFVEDS